MSRGCGQRKMSEKDDVKTDAAPAASSVEDRCPVCLEDYSDKAFVESCFHAFCFTCIVQWSEVANKCPICKATFTTIVYDVKSYENYKTFHVKPVQKSASQQITIDEARRFRYRTTSGPRRRTALRPSSRKPASAERRKSVYLTGLRALPFSTDEKGQRVRDIGAMFFKKNPAAVHRLLPWISRDVTVLLGEDHVEFLLQLILSMIDKVDLKNSEFADHLRPFFHEKTDHFMHELISFAKSPLDMVAYDSKVSYGFAQSHRDGPQTNSETADGETTLTNITGQHITYPPVPEHAQTGSPNSDDINSKILYELSCTDWDHSPPIDHCVPLLDEEGTVQNPIEIDSPASEGSNTQLKASNSSWKRNVLQSSEVSTTINSVPECSATSSRCPDVWEHDTSRGLVGKGKGKGTDSNTFRQKVPTEYSATTSYSSNLDSDQGKYQLGADSSGSVLAHKTDSEIDASEGECYRSPSRRYMERSRSTDRSKSRNRSRSTDRSRSRNRSRSTYRSKSIDRSRSRNRSISTDRSRSRNRSRPTDRSRSRNRSRSTDRSRSRNRSRSTDRSRLRNRSRSTDRSRSRNRHKRAKHKKLRKRHKKSRDGSHLPNKTKNMSRSRSHSDDSKPKYKSKHSKETARSPSFSGSEHTSKKSQHYSCRSKDRSDPTHQLKPRDKLRHVFKSKNKRDSFCEDLESRSSLSPRVGSKWDCNESKLKYHQSLVDRHNYDLKPNALSSDTSSDHHYQACSLEHDVQETHCLKKERKGKRLKKELSIVDKDLRSAKKKLLKSLLQQERAELLKQCQTKRSSSEHDEQMTTAKELVNELHNVEIALKEGKKKLVHILKRIEDHSV